MTCCESRRSSPVVFIAVAALSAVAFFEQATGTPAPGSATTLAAAASLFTKPR